MQHLDFELEQIKNADLFPGRMLARLVGDLVAAHDRALVPFGITCRQGIMMLNCALNEARTPAELARFQDLEISTITRMVDRLCKKGLMRRARDRNDHRRVLLTVTPEGRKALESAIPIAKQVQQFAWKGVTDEERAALHSLIAKILNNLNPDASQLPKAGLERESTPTT